MSSALYTLRLLWNGRLGLAKCGGMQADLTSWPSAAIPGVSVAELHYTPEIRECELREMSGTWRPMKPAEMASAKAWLERVAAATYSAINP